ncbi:copper resistance protein B [Stutzerimonas tarimensis]|uniref:Copper resistance protein B n=1 Tax=Stutzerimonas tarimensis TaxID=1507735 RepID=A0ABV7T5R6_9GAMM
MNKPSLLLALGLSLGVSPAPVLAQSGHAGHHPAPATATDASHSAHEGQDDPHQGHHMHHGHGTHGAAHRARGSDPRFPPLTDAERAAAFPPLAAQHMHGDRTHYRFFAERLEWQDADEGSALYWDFQGWVGGDINRLWMRSEGERVAGHTEKAELQLFWGHAIGPWWESVAGIRQDFKPGSPQTWAALGVQGMPLYGLETQLTAYLGEGGQTGFRAKFEYDVLLTNRLILQPLAEFNLHGRNDPARATGAGFSDAELGLRLRYEITPLLAPYIGVSRHRAYGNTADYLRAAGEDKGDTRLVAGIRFWF